ncbi:FKBP-type peptidyl-prolyl cis-trans isomerase [Cesiribacter andamanensis]|uniref:Peptidyl-prolyl cis-trans isomerase n=1 Tax=Cesiribacter andamanensis AMV16 TaxID=1279009 RepID=M7NV76_9BACT|nr:peptidylprolyl isomerase [Cesiribacter andamanensis]EMR02359.1 FKBP-type peptidyl-prolyl cis-trans isomerase slyD [Cesiribacter andamanensis AMV16]
MEKAQKGDRVRVHYTGRLQNGEVFDSSKGREPLEFEIGGGMMIAGFDKAVNGMQVGDQKTVEIPSNEAYGERREEMMINIPRAQVPADITPQVGQQLALNNGGQQVPVTVTEVTDEKVVLDANHPLAGKDLVFDIELVEIG